MIRAIVLHGEDNVGTMIDDGPENAQVHLIGEAAGALRITSAIPFGHKVAIRAIPSGTEIRKYGQVIGRSTQNILVGAHVHVHNVEALRGRGDAR